MQVENHKEEVPFSHYEGLFRNLDPQAALERLPSAAFDGKRFTLTLLGRTYDITWPDYAISVRDGGCLPACQRKPSFCGACWRPGRWQIPARGKPFGRCPGGNCTSSPLPAAV